jgi:ankyrin repeat protein
MPALLKIGHDPNLKDTYGRTPLWSAAWNRDKAMVKLLLANGGVGLDSKNTKYGQTPLSCTAESGHDAVVKLLLAEDSVDVNPKSHNGQTRYRGRQHTEMSPS